MAQAHCARTQNVSTRDRRWHRPHHSCESSRCATRCDRGRRARRCGAASHTRNHLMLYNDCFCTLAHLCTGSTGRHRLPFGINILRTVSRTPALWSVLSCVGASQVPCSQSCLFAAYRLDAYFGMCVRSSLGSQTVTACDPRGGNAASQSRCRSISPFYETRMHHRAVLGCYNVLGECITRAVLDSAAGLDARQEGSLTSVR
jgi:hypothetical protein